MLNGWGEAVAATVAAAAAVTVSVTLAMHARLEQKRHSRQDMG